MTLFFHEPNNSKHQMSPNNPDSLSSHAPHLHIISGSVTGTALQVSRYLRDNLRSKLTVILHEYPDLNDIIKVPEQLLVFCVSNTGAGELPPVMRKVWVQLTEQDRDMSGHEYLIINFGDRSYREYGLSGKLLDDALKKCGATRLSPRMTIDALVNDVPGERCLRWLMKELGKHQYLP